jgi:multicomponent Na+:H+ antiporter subunit C
MNTSNIAGLAAAAVISLGLYGLIIDPRPLRKVLAFDVLGSGVFLMFGIIARRGAGAGMPADPVPLAMVITGIVVAFAASAIAVGLILRLEEEGGAVGLDPDASASDPEDPAGRS